MNMNTCVPILHLFILSDKRTFFPAGERMQMVRDGIKGLGRITLHDTSDYMVSAATFPAYFFKEKTQAGKINCRLDLELFASRFAPARGRKYFRAMV